MTFAKSLGTDIAPLSRRGTAMRVEENQLMTVDVLLERARSQGVVKSRRRCSCGRKAFTPPSNGQRKMRAGWIYRKGHDLCLKCWRESYNGFKATQIGSMNSGFHLAAEVNLVEERQQL